MAQERVQKFLAHQGIASRRTIEKMINAGRISVNGVVVTEQGTKIDPALDKVAVDGQLIQTESELVYFFIHKPAGIISAATSKYGETTVVDLVDSPARLYPVGRLDKDSEGLLMLTNDGELTHRLTHPRYHLDKTYEVEIEGVVSDKKLNKLRQGILLDEGMTAPAVVELLSENWLRFIIHEGKNRQIRRMCAAVNVRVTRLIRTAIGPIKLGNLPLGHWRPATPQEILTLKSLVGM